MSGSAYYSGDAPPCDSCERRRMCGAQLLACQQLMKWTRYGKAEGERFPSHALYRQMNNQPAIRIDPDIEIADALSSLRARSV